MKQKSKFLSGKRIQPTWVFVKTNFLVLLLLFSFGLIVSGCKILSRAVNKSGTVFTVEIETDAPNRGEIVERAIKVTERKLAAVGVDGEVAGVPGADNRISVKIYGSQNSEALKIFLFTAYRLELKKVVSPKSPAPPQIYSSKESAQKAATADQEVLSYSREKDSPQTFVIVEKKAIVTGEDVRTAAAVPGTLSDSYVITFTLKPEGAIKFGDWTGENIGGYLAIVLDKKVQSIPYIKSQIFDSGQIDGLFTKQSAEDIALSLNSGYLPAAMKVVEEISFGN